MAYPQIWEVQPPQVPSANEKVTAQISQFAAELRRLAKAGELQLELADWLFEYEQQHPYTTPTFDLEESSEIKHRRLQIRPQPSAEGAQVSREEGQRLDRVVDSVSGGVRELRQGFTAVLGELRQGIQALNAGNEELRQGQAQLMADTRSFLGMLFNHQSSMMQQQTEAMAQYRKGTLAEADARVSVATAQLHSAAGDGGVGAEAERAIVGLLAEAVKTKMLGSNQPPETKTEAK